MVLSRSKGTSLVETVITTGLFALVMMIALTFLLALTRTMEKTAKNRNMIQNARVFVEVISKRARQANTITIEPNKVTMVISDAAGADLNYVYEFTPVAGNITEKIGPGNPVNMFTTSGIKASAFTVIQEASLLKFLITLEDLRDAQNKATLETAVSLVKTTGDTPFVINNSEGAWDRVDIYSMGKLDLLYIYTKDLSSLLNYNEAVTACSTLGAILPNQTRLNQLLKGPFEGFTPTYFNKEKYSLNGASYWYLDNSFAGSADKKSVRCIKAEKP